MAPPPCEHYPKFDIFSIPRKKGSRAYQFFIRDVPVVTAHIGAQRTLPLAARYADEWNAVYIPALRFAELNAL